MPNNISAGCEPSPGQYSTPRREGTPELEWSGIAPDLFAAGRIECDYRGVRRGDIHQSSRYDGRYLGGKKSTGSARGANALSRSLRRCISCRRSAGRVGDLARTRTRSAGPAGTTIAWHDLRGIGRFHVIHPRDLEISDVLRSDFGQWGVAFASRVMSVGSANRFAFVPALRPDPSIPAPTSFSRLFSTLS